MELCKLNFCDRPSYLKGKGGLCKSHYEYARVGKELKPLRFKPVRDEFFDTDICIFDDCEKPIKTRGGCEYHYSRANKYGLSVLQLKELFSKVTGCEICGKTERPLVIEHDHSCCPSQKNTCGKCIRGLVCQQCNMVIGMAADEIYVLESAIKYLKTRALNM